MAVEVCWWKAESYLPCGDRSVGRQAAAFLRPSPHLPRSSTSSCRATNSSFIIASCQAVFSVVIIRSYAQYVKHLKHGIVWIAGVESSLNVGGVFYNSFLSRNRSWWSCLLTAVICQNPQAKSLEICVVLTSSIGSNMGLIVCWIRHILSAWLLKVHKTLNEG